LGEKELRFGGFAQWFEAGRKRRKTKRGKELEHPLISGEGHVSCMVRGRILGTVRMGLCRHAKRLGITRGGARAKDQRPCDSGLDSTRL